MHGLIRRAAVVAGAAVVVLVAMAGVASANATVVLGWSPSGTADYGTLSPGATSPPQAFTLTNTGGSGTSALKITVAPAAGTPASAFTMTADTCTGTSLGPKKSCSVSVTFTAPATPGSYGATLAAASNKPAATASVTLTGTSAKATPVITSAQQPAFGVAGDTIFDQATVTGGDNPTGTVTFTLYEGPNCTDGPLLTDTEPLTSGVATGGYVLATGPGTAYWVASYGGDANNNSVSTGCNDEPVTISRAQPIITTSQQPAAATVGTAIADQATLSGGFGLGGFGGITFTLYDNPNCAGTPLFTDHEGFTPGVPVTSKSYTATAAGTDYWVASFLGDVQNNAVTSGCGDEPVTINPSP